MEHHGVKGQKWGVRRYQNKDGSLTAAGRKRYGVGDGTAREYRNSDDFKDDRRKALKTAVKIGAAVTAAGLAVYGAKKYSDAIKDKAFRIQSDKGAEYLRHLRREEALRFEEANAALARVHSIDYWYDEAVKRKDFSEANRIFGGAKVSSDAEYRQKLSAYEVARKTHADASQRLTQNAKKATSSFKDAYKIVQDDRKRKR